MINYEELYFQLTGKVSDAIDILVEALRKAEEQYTSACELVDDLDADSTACVRKHFSSTEETVDDL